MSLSPLHPRLFWYASLACFPPGCRRLAGLLAVKPVVCFPRGLFSALLTWVLSAGVLVAMAAPARAILPTQPAQLAPPPVIPDCFELAGYDARIDPDLLRAIAWQESRLNFQAIGNNAGKSYDIGLMQINSQHLPLMASYGIERQQLISDICVNIYSGAYILAKAFNKWGVNWHAVGAYNAGFALNHRQHQRRMQYARKIYTMYWRLKASKRDD